MLMALSTDSATKTVLSCPNNSFVILTVFSLSRGWLAVRTHFSIYSGILASCSGVIFFIVSVILVAHSFHQLCVVVEALFNDDLVESWNYFVWCVNILTSFSVDKHCVFNGADVCLTIKRIDAERLFGGGLQNMVMTSLRVSNDILPGFFDKASSLW